MTISSLRRAIAFVAALVACTATHAQLPVGSAFSYQGDLRFDGMPVSELTDVRVSLWDAETGGAQFGATQTFDAVAVTDGRFTLALDFGDAFFGDRRWLNFEIRRPAGIGDFVPLLPRQEVLAVPFALFAINGTPGPQGPPGPEGPAGVAGTTLGSATTSEQSTSTSASWKQLDSIAVNSPVPGRLAISASASTTPSRYFDSGFYGATYSTWGVQYRVKVNGAVVTTTTELGSRDFTQSSSNVMGVAAALSCGANIGAGTNTVSLEARVGSYFEPTTGNLTGSGTHISHGITAILIP